MSTAALQGSVLDREHIIVVGAGFNGLMCALEWQRRKPQSQVDIVAQAFVTDPHPLSWTTYLSRCFFNCVNGNSPALKQETFDCLLEKSHSSAASGFFHRFAITEYFSTEKLEEVLHITDFRPLPEEQLIPGAHHAATFTTISMNPIRLAEQMLTDFTSQGGRVFRGTVRHLHELTEGGVSSFQRSALDGTLRPPSAIIVCVGIGARFLGGVEDSTVIPVQIHVVRLRIPGITAGKALYDGDDGPSLFVVPLGNGDVVAGGKTEYGKWYLRPKREIIDDLLAKIRVACPEIVPLDAEDPDKFDLRSLVVWEGCDTFGTRAQGPRLEVLVIDSPERRSVPVVLSYGYGASELQVHRGIAKAAVDLLEGAMNQENLR